MIVMSSNALAQADIWAGAPNDTEYDAVYAAVAATERGRWFLAEYANRNRHADTQLLLDALARIDITIRRDAPAQAVKGTTSTAVTSVVATSLAAAPATADVAAAVVGPVPAIPDDGGRCETAGDEVSRTDLFSVKLEDNKKFAEAVAALAASLTMLTEKDESPAAENDEPAPAPEVQSRPADSVVAAPDYSVMPAPDYAATVAPPVKAEPAPATAPRWYIESPDFVFQRAERQADQVEIESPDNSKTAFALQSEPQLPAGPQEDPADLFESPGGAANAPASSSAAAAHPPLRIANGPVAWPVLRPSLSDSLAGVRSLSEDELIALFG